VHSLTRLVQDPIHEGFVQRGVARQEPEGTRQTFAMIAKNEQRAVEQVEGDLDIEVAAHFTVLHRPLEQGLPLGAASEDEVIAESLAAILCVQMLSVVVTLA